MFGENFLLKSNQSETFDDNLQVIETLEKQK